MCISMANLYSVLARCARAGVGRGWVVVAIPLDAGTSRSELNWSTSGTNNLLCEFEFQCLGSGSRQAWLGSEHQVQVKYSYSSGGVGGLSSSCLVASLPATYQVLYPHAMQAMSRKGPGRLSKYIIKCRHGT